MMDIENISGIKKLRIYWINHYRRFLFLAVTLMSIAASIWLCYEFSRLLFQPKQIGFYQVHPGAIDLKMLHNQVCHWFAGMPVYGEISDATYPPASYVILWPFIGWLPLKSAVWFWAFTSIVALVGLIYLILQASGARSFLEKLFVALMPLSMYATGATIGNGQLIIHLVPLLIAGLLLFGCKKIKWQNDLIASLLILASLVKPSISAPFCWIVFLVPGRLRPLLIIIFGYMAITLFAGLFQEQGLLSLLSHWMEQATMVSSNIQLKYNQSNLHAWFNILGIEGWDSFASLLLFFALGIWVYFNRTKDIWLLMGVAAIISRFWTYHGWYDDFLIIIPMVSLFRIVKQQQTPAGTDVIAVLLLIATVAIMLAPGGLYLIPPPWNIIYTTLQAIIWILVLIFLIKQSKIENIQ